MMIATLLTTHKGPLGRGGRSAVKLVGRVVTALGRRDPESQEGTEDGSPEGPLTLRTRRMSPLWPRISCTRISHASKCPNWRDTTEAEILMITSRPTEPP